MPPAGIAAWLLVVATATFDLHLRLMAGLVPFVGSGTLAKWAADAAIGCPVAGLLLFACASRIPSRARRSRALVACLLGLALWNMLFDAIDALAPALGSDALEAAGEVAIAVVLAGYLCWVPSAAAAYGRSKGSPGFAR